ncbi:MAG: flavodoxin family protein [Candidatus Hodarchaeales archaeon]|jgi:multimeric flavodoxin WrbA
MNIRKNMTRKRIVIIKGSPRRGGNSCSLADSVIQGAKDNDAHVDDFFLQKMNIKPCNACNACIKQVEKECIIDDDMQAIYSALREADAIVIASPTYWFNISAQTKLFIDRLYGLVEPNKDIMRSKKIGIILTYGDSDQYSSGAINAINSFKDTFRYIGSEIVGIVHGSASDKGEIKKNQDLMDEAYSLGCELSA